MPDAGVLATVLLIVGLFLLALELMIPSFGLIGILSAISLLISAWCAWQAWWEPSPGLFWTYAAFWLLGIPSVLGGALFLLQNTSFGDRLVLRAPAGDSNASPKQEQNQLASLIGDVAVTESLLTPGGMVSLNQQRFHAESPGMVIEPGTPVQIVDVKGNRLVVREYRKDISIDQPEDAADLPKSSGNRTSDSLAQTVVASDQTDASLTESGAGGDATGILDFDIPED